MSFLAFELNTKVFYSLLTSIDPKCGIKLKINSSSMYMVFMTLTTFDKYFNISRWLKSLNWTFLCSYYHFQFLYDFDLKHVCIWFAKIEQCAKGNKNIASADKRCNLHNSILFILKCVDLINMPVLHDNIEIEQIHQNNLMFIGSCEHLHNLAVNNF